MMLIGFYNFGSDIFTLEHFSQSRSYQRNPLLVIIAVIYCSIGLIYKTLDMILSKSIYISVHENSLYKYLKKGPKLDEIDYNSLKWGGMFNNVLIMNTKSNKKFQISTIYGTEYGDKFMEKIKSLENFPKK